MYYRSETERETEGETEKEKEQTSDRSYTNTAHDTTPKSQWYYRAEDALQIAEDRLRKPISRVAAMKSCSEILRAPSTGQLIVGS